MSDPLGEADDLVAAFQVDGHAARGRIVRMGAALDDIVSAHDHPPAVKRLVGEAVLLAALVGDSLKFDGRLIVQANGNGPVNFVVAEWNSVEPCAASPSIPASRSAMMPAWRNCSAPALLR